MMDAGSGQGGSGNALAAKGEGVPPRRQYPVELKRRVVEETFAPGASVSVVARRHDLNANLVFEWRNQYRKGRLWGGNPSQATRQHHSPASAAALSPPDLIRIGVIDHEGGLEPLPAAVPSSTECAPPSPVKPLASAECVWGASGVSVR